MTLTSDSLANAMENSSDVDYAALFPAVNECLLECGCTTVDRAAMWFGEVGEESGGLRYMEELASGDEYEGRSDLGNTEPGDGPRFKGRGPIQVTGRHNYTVLSQWAFGKGYVPSRTFFVDDPAQLATSQYGFIGVTWYWTTQRPMNDAADARDVVLATQYVNGGTNGLDDRTQRWNHALGMGDAILPSDSAPKPVAAPNFSEDNQLGVNSNFESRRNTTIDLFLIHTEEAEHTAQGLADFLKSTEGTDNPRSYHYSIDNAVTVIDICDTDDAAWSVGNSNLRTINYCFAGSFVAWNRQDWLNNMGNGIDVCAYLIVQDCRKYGQDPTKVIAPPYNSDPPGVSDHRYCGAHLHDGNNHTDVDGPDCSYGPPYTQFPWDVFIQRINYYAGNTTEGFLMSLSDQQQQQLFDKIMAYPSVPGLAGKWPSRSIYRPTNDGVDDTVGILLNVDGSVHELTVENRALMGFPDDVALITATANGESAGSKLGDGTPDESAIARAKFVLSKCTPVQS